jgi:DNA-binding transcriptional MocR family regulator
MDIAAVVQRHRLPLIEDDAYGFVQPNAPAPFATLVPELTWHIGGLAKCIGAGLRLAFSIAPDSRSAFQLAQALRVANVMASPLSMALVTRWIEDGTADRICRFIRAESAARQDIAGRLLQGFDFTADRHAFNIWLKVPAWLGRAEVLGRMNGRGLGLMPSDAFTVLGPPDEHVRICLGGSITREGLRSSLSFLAGSLNGETWLG